MTHTPISNVARTRKAIAVRRAALSALIRAKVPFLVTGAYAFFEYTGIYRDTKDLDIAVRRCHLDVALDALAQEGFETEVLNPVWLAKAYFGAQYIDLIFSSGNGLAVVDDLWFEHGRNAMVAGYPCLLSPPEEMIWSKAFVSERERYDGADINHLIYACGKTLDWRRLLDRFEPHWEVLFAHVVLYRFTYPSQRSHVPEWLIEELCGRTLDDLALGDVPGQVCRGNLISSVQYLHDYEHGFSGDHVPAPPSEPEGVIPDNDVQPDLDRVG